MSTAPTLAACVLVAGLFLLTPAGRPWMTAIALRRFFERYMREPRHRIFDPRKSGR